MSGNKEKRRPNVSECLDVFLLSPLCSGSIIKEAKDCLLPVPAEKRRMSMGEKGCSISEAAKRSGVEAYVLRYWEEEGLLHVPRDAKGHRYYTEEEFAAISSIQKLKKEGLSIKDIRNVTVHPKGKEQTEEKQKDVSLSSVADAAEEDKKQQFYVILERLVKEITLTRNREARYRRLDEAIRRQQESRKMTAAMQENSTHGKRR